MAIGRDPARVDIEHDVFGDGSVICLPTYGHKPGHQSLRVRLDSGEVVLAADSCYFCRTLRERRLPRRVHDRAAMLASLDRLATLETGGAASSLGTTRSSGRPGRRRPRRSPNRSPNPGEQQPADPLRIFGVTGQFGLQGPVLDNDPPQDQRHAERADCGREPGAEDYPARHDCGDRPGVAGVPHPAVGTTGDEVMAALSLYPHDRGEEPVHMHRPDEECQPRREYDDGPEPQCSRDTVSPVKPAAVETGDRPMREAQKKTSQSRRPSG